MAFDTVKLVGLAQERRDAAELVARRMLAVQSEIRHQKQVRMVIDIMPAKGAVEIEDHTVLVVASSDESIKAAFARAIRAFRAEEVQQRVQEPIQLLSTDFHISLDTAGEAYVPLDLEEHDIYPLVEKAINDEVTNNQPED